MGNVFGCKKDGSMPIVRMSIAEAAIDEDQVPRMSNYYRESYGVEHSTAQRTPDWLPQVPKAPTPVRKRAKKLRLLAKHWNTSATLAHSLHRWKLLLLFSPPTTQIANMARSSLQNADIKQHEIISAHINVVFVERKCPWGIGFSAMEQDRGASVTALEDILVRNSFECYHSTNNAQSAGVRLGDVLVEVNGENVQKLPHVEAVQKVKKARLPCTLSFVGEREDISVPAAAPTTSSTNPFVKKILPEEICEGTHSVGCTGEGLGGSLYTEADNNRDSSHASGTHLDVQIDVVFTSREIPWCIGLTSNMSFSRATQDADHCPDDCGALVAVLEEHKDCQRDCQRERDASICDDDGSSSTARTESHGIPNCNRAEAAGVRIGDRLVSVNGKAVEGLPHMEIVNEVKTAPLPCTLKFMGKRKEGWMRPVLSGMQEDEAPTTKFTEDSDSSDRTSRSSSSSSSSSKNNRNFFFAIRDGDMVTPREDTNHSPHNQSSLPYGGGGNLSPNGAPNVSSSNESKKATYTAACIDSDSAADPGAIVIAAVSGAAGAAGADTCTRTPPRRLGSAAVATAQKKLQEQVISKEEFAIIAAADQKRQKQDQEDWDYMIQTGQLMKNLDRPGEFINILTGAIVVQPKEP
jgi:hypothetical protein